MTQMMRDFGRLEGETRSEIKNLREDIARIEAKLDPVLEHINKQKGAFAVAIAVGAAIGAFLAKAVTFLPVFKS